MSNFLPTIYYSSEVDSVENFPIRYLQGLWVMLLTNIVYVLHNFKSLSIVLKVASLHFVEWNILHNLTGSGGGRMYIVQDVNCLKSVNPFIPIFKYFAIIV